MAGDASKEGHAAEEWKNYRGAQELPPTGGTSGNHCACNPTAPVTKSTQVPLDFPEKQVKYEESLGLVLETV